MTVLLWCSVAVPLLAAVVVRASPGAARATTVAGAALTAVPPVALLAGAADGHRAGSSFTWLPGLDVGLRLDPLAAAMSATVAVVGLVVLVYAVGYFADEPRRASALAGLLAFVAAMQGLVLADGYLALLIFWELVGAASARLIAFNRDDPAAAPGAVRAFLTTRTADIGFYVALLALVAATGSVAFEQARPAGALGAVVAVGLLLAAMGKSAQAPLQTWLSGAMAGPTPVSALLHSATMVAAGVYLLMRSTSLLTGWPLQAAGWIGALTAVAAAVMALAQPDLKRVLAGSTASQLGLMFVGVAAGGPAVALFQLVTHAVSKAGLFLAAGIFQHQRGTVELDGLRGAGRDAPRVFAMFVVCALSIAAVPPFAAFWSKDHIAAAAEPHPAWFVLVLLSAAGAAAYLWRPGAVLWDGEVRRAGAGTPRVMVGALAVLAAGAVVAGALGGPIERLLKAPPLPTSTTSLVLSLVAVALGAAAAAFRWRPPAVIARAAYRQLGTAALQRWLVVAPVMAVSALADRVERRVLDAAVEGIGRAGLRLARASDDVERHGIDASVDGLAALVGRGGKESRRLQSGRLHEYLRDAVLGAVALAVLIALAAVT